MRSQVVRRWAGAGASAGLLVLASALGSVALAADTTVDIVGFSFSPGSVSVSVGDTVTWANADAQGHTATADGGAFDTGTIGGNASKTVTLATAGTFAYHCAIHPTMTATLVVSAAGAPPPTDTEVAAAATAGSAAPGAWAAILLALAGAGGWAIGRRRFRSR